MYLMDSNSFITPANSYYDPEILPSFWCTLLDSFENHKIATIDMVEEEVTRGSGFLTDWFKNNVSGRFVLNSMEDVEVLKQYRVVLKTVRQNTQYAPEQKNRFFSGADPWLIATAKVYDYVVVTLEVLVGNNSKKVKIPNICEQFGVKYVDLREMMKSLGMRV